MAKSLQEQLLAAGALDKGRAQKLKKQKHKQAKQRSRGAASDDEIKRAADRAAAEKLARDRELSREQQAQAEARAIAAQVRQLIETNRIDRADGEMTYHFSDHNIVKSVAVSDAQHQQLAQGKVAIVRLDGSYELIAAPVANKIAERDSDCVVVLNDSNGEDEPGDDDYADYKIPDDLSW